MKMKWYRAFLLVLVSIFFSTTFSAAEKIEGYTPDTSDLEESALPSEKRDATSPSVTAEKKEIDRLLRVKGTILDREYLGNENGYFGLEALWGKFFSPFQDKFLGYYLLSGMVETDDTQRLNATVGYFVPVIGGETRLTYKLLHTEVRALSSICGEKEEDAIEQAAGLFYRKRFDTLLKALTFKYAYTNLSGESTSHGIFQYTEGDRLFEAEMITGFGDTDSHNSLLEVAVGSDVIDSPFLEGIRLDLGGGYQRIEYGDFLGDNGFTDEGFTATVDLKLRTPFGILKGGYLDLQSSTIAYGGYQVGGLDIYYKKIDYTYGEEEEIIGAGFTVNLFDPTRAFDPSSSRLFFPSDRGFINIDQMDHIPFLSADELIVKPRVATVATNERDITPVATTPSTPSPPGPCAPSLPNGSPCTLDCECQFGWCSSSGTCGGNFGELCGAYCTPYSSCSACKDGFCSSTGECWDYLI